jgi:hypothetical protein
MASFILRNEIFVDQDEWWQHDVQRSIEQTTYKNMIVNNPFEVILENVISSMTLENSSPFFTVFIECGKPWTNSCPFLDK